MAKFDKIAVLNKIGSTGMVPVFYHKDAEVAKNRLRALSSAISSESIESQISAVKNIALDSKITPNEKKGLAMEWERIKLSYASTKSNAEDLGVTDRDQYKAMESAYRTLYSLMENVLANMNTPSSVDMNFTIAFDSYIATSSSFTSYMINIRIIL